jgi:hypothetical protein
MQSNLAEFLAYYEAAHRNVANRYVHHVAHATAAVGVLLLWRPLLGLLLIAASFALSWVGHYLLERNTPAFFAEAERGGFWASLAKKIQVALGGMAWSAACFLRVFHRGPLARASPTPGVAQRGAQADGPSSGGTAA